MASKRPPLNEVLSLFESTIAAEGTTTTPGAVAGNSFIDAGLIGVGDNSFLSMLAILYPGQPRLVDSFDITGFNNLTGEITLANAYKGVPAAIPAGVPYKIVTFRFVPAEVAAIEAKLDRPDVDDVLNTRIAEMVGRKDDTIPAMNLPPGATDSLVRHIKAILERLGATPADADDSVLTNLGQRDDVATADSLVDVTTTSIEAKLRLILNRMAPNAFGATVNGNVDTALDDMIAHLAAYFVAAGAALSVTIDPGGAARTTLATIWNDLGQMLAGTAAGLTTFPAASAPGNGISLARVIRYISDNIDAMCTLYETGGTLLADGTEQNVVIDDAPASVFIPIKVMIDLTDMAGVDNTIIKLYYRIAAGGAYILKDTVTYTGPQDPGLINVELEPNRHGFKVTLQQTAGTNRNYIWGYFYES